MIDSGVDGGIRLPRRLRRLSQADALGGRFPVARGVRARLVGLSLLGGRDRIPGLLIPGCRSIHTFGMRFALDLYFLDGRGKVILVRRAVPPRRIVRERRADSVLEVPAAGG